MKLFRNEVPVFHLLKTFDIMLHEAETFKQKAVYKMPNIRPISDLRNNSNEISEFCRTTREPVFITKNGVGDMVVMSIEMYERQEAQLNLYTKLGEAEIEPSSGSGGADFFEFAKKYRIEANG